VEPEAEHRDDNVMAVDQFDQLRLDSRPGLAEVRLRLADAVKAVESLGAAEVARVVNVTSGSKASVGPASPVVAKWSAISRTTSAFVCDIARPVSPGWSSLRYRQRTPALLA
jgi:hypothetical protein